MQQFVRNFFKLSQSQLGKYQQKYGSFHPLMNNDNQLSFFQNQKLYTNIDYKQLLENYYQKNHHDQKKENHKNHNRDSDRDRDNDNNYNQYRTNGAYFHPQMVFGSMLGATSIWLHNHKLKAISNNELKSFEEILEKIKSRDDQYYKYNCINLRGIILTKEQLEQLNIALDNNFIIGDIWWDEGQNDKNHQDLKDEIEAKISRNINEHGLHATDFVHGLLSMHVYQDSKEGDSVILENSVSKITKQTKFTSEEENLWNQQLKGWKVQKVHDKNGKKESGYYGVLYENKDTHQLVLAHRGTGSLKSVKADIAEIASNSETIGFKGDIYDACKQASDYANKHQYHLSVTGHSLGAWSAELSIYLIEYTNMMPDLRPKAVTFDSPGSSNIMEVLKSNINNKNTLETKKLNIVTYLSFPNVVNSFSEHIGKHYCLFPSFQKFKKEEYKKEMAILLDLLDAIQSVSSKTAKKTEIFAQINTKLNEHENVKLFMDFFGIGKIINTGAKINKGAKIIYQGLSIGRDLEGHQIYLMLRQFKDGKHGKPPLENCEEIKDWPSSYKKDVKQTTEEDVISQLKTIFDDFYQGKLSLNQYLGASKATKPTNSIEEYKNIFVNHLYTTEFNPYQDTYQNVENTADWWLIEINDHFDIIKKTKMLSPFMIKQLETMNHKVKKEFITTTDDTFIKSDISIAKFRDIISKLKTIFPQDFIGYISKKGYSTKDNKLILQSNVPIHIGENYFPREKYIKEIQDKLKTHKVVIISAVGGTGKSSVAAEYIKFAESQNSDLCIHWLQGTDLKKNHNKNSKSDSTQNLQGDDNEDSKKFFGEYQNFAKILNLQYLEKEKENVVIESINTKLLSYEKNAFLLIFDNVISYEKVAHYIQNLPSNVKVLISTQQNLRISPDYGVIKLQPFTEDEAQEYIQKQLPQLKSNKAEVKKLLNKVTLLPQKLSMAVGYLKNTDLPITINEYIQKVDYIFEQLKKRGEIDKEDKELILLANFIVTAEKLISQSPNAWKMLQYSAFLDPSFIPKEVLENAMKEDLNILNDLNKIIKNLKQFSLMDAIKKDGVNGFNIHQITQNDVQEYRTINTAQSIPSQKIQSDLVKILDALMPLIDHNPDEKWTKANLYHACAEKLIDTQMQDINSEMTNLSNKIGNNYREIFSDLPQSLKYYKQTLEMRQRLHNGQPHPDVAESLNDVGLAYEVLGGRDNVRKGLKLQEQALEMRQQLYKGQPHTDVAESLNGVGVAYQNLRGRDNIQKGLRLQEQALEMYQQLYKGQPHTDVAESLNNVGMAYKDLGGHDNIQKSLKLLEQALEMWQQIYNGQPHLYVAISLNNVGSRYKALGEYDNVKKGLKLQEQALEMYQQLYKEQPHLHVAISLNNVGLGYQALGGQDNIQKSFKLQEQALEMHQQLHKGQPHPDVANSLNNVGFGYKALGNKIKALDYIYQAYVMSKKLNGEDDIDTQEYKENILNIDPDYFKNNPGGDGMMLEVMAEAEALEDGQWQVNKQKQEDMPIYKWFTKYYAEGVDVLLALRSKDLKHAVSLPFMQLKDDAGQMVHIVEDTMHNSDSGFDKVIAQAFDKVSTVLIPLNLYGKHWVGLGLSLDKHHNTIQVTYIDPENRAISTELQPYLEAILSSYTKIIVLQRFVEAQKYKNCGPQVIEELVAFAAEREGKVHTKIPQEEVIPAHSMLLEKKLLSSSSSPLKVLPKIIPKSEDVKYYTERDNGLYKLVMEHKFSIMHSKEMVLDQNQPSYLVLDEKALAQLKYYTKTGMLLPTAQAALEHGAQINIRYNITDVYHTRTVTFNGQHYMDEKIMAQILHYMQGGQMFDTLRHTVVANVVHFEEATYTNNRQVEEQMHRLQGSQGSQEVIIPIVPQANIPIDEESTATTATTDNDQQHHLILNLFTFIKNTLQEHSILYFIES